MEAKDLFEPKLWQKLSEHEKKRLSNVYDKYRKMEELGFEATPPDFVLAYNEKNKRNRSKQDSERDLPPAKRPALDVKTEARKRKSQSIKEHDVPQTDDTDAAVVASESPASPEDSSATTSGKLMKGRKEFAMEIFTLGDDKTVVTRSKWNKKNDPGTSLAGKSRYLMRNSARNKKYCDDSTTEDEDEDIESSDESEFEDGKPKGTSGEEASEPESGEP